MASKTRSKPATPPANPQATPPALDPLAAAAARRAAAATSPTDRPGPETRPEAEPLPSPHARIGLANAVDASKDAAPLPGVLPLDVKAPQLPAQLLAPLSPRDVRLVWELVRGSTWGNALDAVHYPKRGTLRDGSIPAPIRHAAEYLVAEIAKSAGISRGWIQGQYVALYRRAAQGEEVLDRKGNPTGIYRFDGATARACLRDLGEDMGMFGKGKSGLAVSDVAELLAAVAGRGKPELSGDRARVIPGTVVHDRPGAIRAERPRAPAAALLPPRRTNG